MVAGIYYIENTATHQFYVGQSINIKKNRTRHLNNLRTHKKRKDGRTQENAHLQNSFDKYGEEHFQWGVLELIENASVAQLEKREQEWIDQYKVLGFEMFNQRPSSKSNAGLKKTAEHMEKITAPQRKAVIQFDIKTGEMITIWPSIREAARALDILNSGISDVCRGRLKTSGGYKWKYAIEGQV